MKIRKNNKFATRSVLPGVDLYEGDSLERELKKKLEQKEPIPVIMDTAYTEKKVGVIEAYNIRTDRFEVGQREAERIGEYRAAKKAWKNKQAEPTKAPKNNDSETPEA